jgi:HEAT repeat protein
VASFSFSLQAKEKKSKPLTEDAIQRKTEVILKVLKYGTSLERKAALFEIEKLPEDKRDPFKTILLESLNKEKDLSMKQAFIRSAGELGLKDAKETIEEAVADENEDVSRAAVSALKKVGDANSWKPILEKLKSEDLTKNSNLTVSLINSLADIEGGENAHEFLEAKLKEKFNSPEIRSYTALYFGKKKILSAETILQEIAFNESETTTLRTYSINSLGKIKSTTSIPKLKELIEEIRKDPSKDNKKNQLLKIYSLGALIELGDETAFDEIVEFSKDDDSIVRLRSIQFLLDSKRPEVREILEYKSKRDPSPKVQKAAADALKKLDEGDSDTNSEEQESEDSSESSKEPN